MMAKAVASSMPMLRPTARIAWPVARQAARVLAVLDQFEDVDRQDEAERGTYDRHHEEAEHGHGQRDRHDGAIDPG